MKLEGCTVSLKESSVGLDCVRLREACIWCLGKWASEVHSRLKRRCVAILDNRMRLSKFKVTLLYNTLGCRWLGGQGTWRRDGSAGGRWSSGGRLVIRCLALLLREEVTIPGRHSGLGNMNKCCAVDAIDLCYCLRAMLSFAAWILPWVQPTVGQARHAIVA